MKLPSIHLEASATGRGSLSVDGVALPAFRTVDVRMGVGELTTVTISMGANSKVDLSGAKLVISGVEMPESVELSMLAYLSRKFSDGRVGTSRDRGSNRGKARLSGSQFVYRYARSCGRNRCTSAWYSFRYLVIGSTGTCVVGRGG